MPMRVPLTLEWPLNLEDNQGSHVAAAEAPTPLSRALPQLHSGGATAVAMECH